MIKVHGGDIYSYEGNILDFSANINPLGIQQHIVEAAKASVMNMGHYPDVECITLRKAIAGMEKVDVNDIICGNGAAEIIFNIVAVLKPKKVLFLAPTFAEYEQAVDTVGASKSFYYIKEDKDFTVEEDILENITEDVDMIFLCNPNNPTGKVMDVNILKKIADKCVTNDTFLVIDECFMDFVSENDQYTMLPYINDYRNNLMIIKAFTKMYAMPGIRLGYGISCNHELLEKMYVYRQPWSVSVVAQAAGEAATELTGLAELTRQYVNIERKFLMNELSKLNVLTNGQIKAYESKANYILIKSSEGLDRQLLDYRILIRNCDNYRGLKKGYYRIAVRTHEENIELIDAVRKILS